jgi:transcriptional regulator with XRE-family HTH domain
MPRTRLPTLSTDLAAELRKDVRAGIKRKRKTREQLAVALDVDRRTVSRYLSDAAPLSRPAAYDLIAACKTLGFTVSVELISEIYSEDVSPAAIVFPGESEALADMLAAVADTVSGFSPQMRRALKARLLTALKPYERFNDTPTGKFVIFQVRSRLGKKWRERLHQIRDGVTLFSNRTSRELYVESRSELGLVQQAQRRSASGRAKLREAQATRK